MHKIIWIALSCVGACMPLLQAQNLHVAYRSKMVFGGQTVANVWGYAAAGREYALIGASKGMIIADITNPDAPQQIVQIPGPDNLWKEIKTYGHYAYVTSEGGQGLQIIDLGNLPNPNLAYHYYTGNGAISGALWRIHSLHIDTTKGFAYLYGCRQPNGAYLFSGGAVAVDLKADPYNPVYAGKFDQLNYIHDGYADNDTLYAGHIYDGNFSVVNMNDKSNPELITSQSTPDKFTHNTWLTDDRRTLLTTDERNNSFLAAYDISDLNNIRLLDKIQSNPGSNAMVHNTVVRGNFAITSWYKDGFTIVDVTHPDNLVQVGNYDTYPNGSGGNSEGCWGAYPYFPSGNIVASTIAAFGTNNGEIWVLTPEYMRACYLEGRITDGLSGNPLNGATIEIVGKSQTTTGATGEFKMGQEPDGYFIVRISKAGYQNQEFTALLQRGDVRILNTSLYPTGGITVNGNVISADNGAAIAGATVSLSNWSGIWQSTTDASGYFLFSSLPPGVYNLNAGAAGFGHLIKYKQKFSENKTLTLPISPKYRLFGPGNTATQNEATAFPNPFRDATELILPSETTGGTLRVLNQAGSLIQQTAIPAQMSVRNLGCAWPAGVYFLTLELNGEAPQIIKLIKSN